jgi:alkanesulfonate monooxygenase SsuD/methylene tetrahydromethanopterin reductase-like flavin-dependent oxidoreductase (luciferase family)
MLPNHSPLVIAEQFGTLAALYPGRIDLGLGRAPGSDMLTARALRRDSSSHPDRFPQDVLELQAYFGAAEPGQAVRAVPGEGLKACSGRSLQPCWAYRSRSRRILRRTR